MRERDNVVIYAYKPFCFSKAERFLLFECGGHSNNKSNENGGLHASKIKNCGVDQNLAPAARTVGRFIPSYEAKAPLRLGFQRPLVLSEPLTLLLKRGDTP